MAGLRERRPRAVSPSSAAVIGERHQGALPSARAPAERLERAVIINDDCVESGGAAGIARASAVALRDRGVPVTFLSGGTVPDRELLGCGVEVHCLGGIHVLAGFRGSAAIRGLFDVHTSGALAKWITTNDTPGTCYHLHNWHKVLSPSVFRPLRDVRRRLAITAHDYFLACPNGGFFDYPRELACELVPGTAACALRNCDRRNYGHKLWRLARHKLRRQLFALTPGAGVVFAVHQGMIPLLERGGIPAAAVRVLPNPVTPWRTERVPVERNSEVVFVGRLEEDKGVRHLALAARRAGVPLRIIGAGPLSKDLARDFPEAALEGWQSRNRIAELIGSARFLVAPSRWRETFGLAPLEALMSGVPVIVSQHALIARDVVEAGFGMACDPHDIDALAGAMRELAGDDDRVRDMSLRAFGLARGMAPTAEQWGDALTDLYAAIVTSAAHYAATKPAAFPPECRADASTGCG